MHELRVVWEADSAPSRDENLSEIEFLLFLDSKLMNIQRGPLVPLASSVHAC